MVVIYKFQNKINQKIYIGQTNNFQKRYSSHKSSAYNKQANDYNVPFHNAIRKYGIENFSYEILEEIPDNESQDFIDEREQFFIAYYNSSINENGYNVSKGGKGYSPIPLPFEERIKKSKIFTPNEIIDIQNRLLNDEEFDSIETLYPQLKRSYLLNINCGLNFYNEKLEYPLKKNSRSKFSKNEIEQIKQMIKDNITYKEIQKKFDIKSLSFISGINTGKYFYDKNEKYPLCTKGNSRLANVETARKIQHLLITSTLTYEQIGILVNRSPSTIKAINAGRNHKSCFKYPLRKNKKYNITIL